MQVICPGCSRPVVVGPMPPGALPSCPYCRTVLGAASTPHGIQPDKPVVQGELRLDERTARRRVKQGSRRLGWGILFLVLCAGAALVFVVAYLPKTPEKERKSAEPVAEPPKPRSPPVWQQIHQWSSEKNMKTRVFRVESPSWRITWSCRAREGDGRQSFNVYIHARDGKLIANPITSLGDGGDTTYVTTEPGEYYLEIAASGMRWELTAEDQR